MDTAKERIEEVTDRIHSVARWMEKGTRYDQLWQHSSDKLRTMSRRLYVLTRGRAMMMKEANAEMQPAKA